MPYTDEDLVGEIIEVDEGDVLVPFIRAANRLVVHFCVPFLNDGTDNEYTEEDLLDIETWLAAHFYACFRRQVRGEQAGTVREDYEGKVDLHLDVTIYGQQAIVLDWNGGLAGWNNTLETVRRRIDATLQWLGVADEFTVED